MDAKPVVLKEESSAGSFFNFPHFNVKIFLAVLLVLFLVGSIGVGIYLTKNPFPFRPHASGSADLAFTPPQTTVSTKSQFTTHIAVDSPDLSVTAAELHIQWDPQFLSLTSFIPGDFLDGSIEQQATIASGSASLTVVPAGFSGKKGQGNIAALTFSTLQTTSTPTQVTIGTGTRVTALENTTGSVLGTIAPLSVTINEASASASPSASPIPSPSPEQSPTASASASLNPSYDFNDDGSVNAVDLSIMYSGWGTPQTDKQKKADINGDGVVNGQDYDVFITHFSL